MGNSNFKLDQAVGQRGSSLLELLFSMLLTSMLVLVLAESTLTAMRGWHQLQMLVAINQRGRIALLIFRRQLEDCLQQQCRVQGFSSKEKKGAPIKRYQGDLLVLKRQPQTKHSQLSYYVAKNRRQDAHGQSLAGLYQKRGSKRAIELVEGIAAIHFLYWQATPSPGFYPAAAIANWSKVKLIEVVITLYPYATKGVLPHPQLLNWSMDVAIK
jgi:hypothetical protein